jgi:gliding motility-associated-like protein
VVLTVQVPGDWKISRTICQGQTFTLPWGVVVAQTGIYRDTLRYAGSGCDSLRREVNLIVQSATVQLQTPVICQGQYFTLPWGVTVNKTGIYRDTLKYSITACDSIYHIVDLTVKPAQIFTLNPVICSDSSFRLPWGPLVNTPGTYKDTIRTKEGCDSLVRTVNLTVNPTPPLAITKSNDVNCILGTAKLGASPGYTYQWSPASSLDNPVSRTPTATPSSSTMYKLKVTASNGCIANDSILVQVSATPSDNDFPVPNAFTPNGDGKNDCFGIARWGYVSNLKFSIFNRWGDLVFSTTNPNDCWDGRVNGIVQGTGGYVYLITALTNCGRVERKGMIMLVR